MELTDREDLCHMLANVFYDQSRATRIWDHAGFPRERIPAWLDDANSWWSEVFFKLDRGIFHSPYRRVIIAARDLYPDNPCFSRLASRYLPPTNTTPRPVIHPSRIKVLYEDGTAAGGNSRQARNLKGYLLDEEYPMFLLRRHWVDLLRRLATLLALLAATMVAFAIAFFSPLSEESQEIWTILLLIFGSLICVFYGILTHRTSGPTVTNQRIILTSGLLFKRFSEVRIHDIADVSYAWNPVSKRLGYGDLVLDLTGGREPCTFRTLRSPNQACRLLIESQGWR